MKLKIIEVMYMKISKEQFSKLPEHLQKHFKKKEFGVSRNVHPT